MLTETLEGNRTEAPSTWVLTELVNNEMQRHEQELTAVLDSKLSRVQRHMLDALFEKESTDDDVDTKLGSSFSLPGPTAMPSRSVAPAFFIPGLRCIFQMFLPLRFWSSGQVLR